MRVLRIAATEAAAFRPRPFLSHRALRDHVLRTDNALGLTGDTLEHIVPKVVLHRVSEAHKLKLDAFTCVALPARLNCSHGSRRIGVGPHMFEPPPVLRGVYARSALYVACVSARALDDVHANVMSIDTALQWHHDNPVQDWEVQRYVSFVRAQGAYVLRESCAGALDWAEARTDDVCVGHALSHMGSREVA